MSICPECGSDEYEVVDDTVWCRRCGALVADMDGGSNCEARLGKEPGPIGKFLAGGGVAWKLQAFLYYTNSGRAPMPYSVEEYRELKRAQGRLVKRHSHGCRVAGCPNEHWTRGLCMEHYREARAKRQNGPASG